MTSIERTAYPQFRRLTSARVLHVFFTPSDDEVEWARDLAETAEALLALLVALKCFQKMARFCPLEEVPPPVIDHVRRCLGLSPEVEPDHGAARTMRWHRAQARKGLGATRDMRRARALAEAAIRDAALVRNHPPDLINIALELYKTDKRGRQRVQRTVYECGVFQTLRDKLRCKEIWVVGADRWRNPDEDLPAGQARGDASLQTAPAIRRSVNCR